MEMYFYGMMEYFCDCISCILSTSWRLKCRSIHVAFVFVPAQRSHLVYITHSLLAYMPMYVCTQRWYTFVLDVLFR